MNTNYLKSLHLSLAVCFCAVAAPAEEARQTDAFASRTIVYKSASGSDLNLHWYEPAKRETPAPAPAIVFFFGGGWIGGTPTQFFPQCEYFAARGLVAVSVEYRTANSHGVSPYACLRDAKSAIRWIRQHAGKYNIDPDRIVASGGSAGGHLAICTALIDEFDEVGETLAVSSKPNALVLFNPPTDTTQKKTRAARVGDSPEELSPIHHVRPGLPPSIVFHGTADTAVMYDEVVRFTKRMRKVGNRCELVSYEGEKHGFFNYSRNLELFSDTVAKADRFLSSLGYLQGEPTVADFIATRAAIK